MLLSRNFCHKSVSVNFRFYHTEWERKRLVFPQCMCIPFYDENSTDDCLLRIFLLNPWVTWIPQLKKFTVDFLQVEFAMLGTKLNTPFFQCRSRLAWRTISLSRPLHFPTLSLVSSYSIRVFVFNIKICTVQ